MCKRYIAGVHLLYLAIDIMYIGYLLYIVIICGCARHTNLYLLILILCICRSWAYVLLLRHHMPVR